MKTNTAGRYRATHGSLGFRETTRATPAGRNATYHLIQTTPIIFLATPSAIGSTDPLRPRTYYALDVATARPSEVRADVGATNKSSVPLRIGSGQIAAHHCNKPSATASPCETGSKLAHQKSNAKSVSQER